VVNPGFVATPLTAANGSHARAADAASQAAQADRRGLAARRVRDPLPSASRRG
jgi:hypothetical protein